MRIASVVHILGFLLMCLGIAMLLPIPFSLFYGEKDYMAFLISAGITLIVGYSSFITTDLDRDLRTREGFAVVTFAWLFLSIFGALPFLLSGAIPGITNAFFETMSGFTTTGATILEDIGVLSHGMLFWRSLTHWIGGMGIIVLSLAILPFLGVGGMQLFKAEVPGPVADLYSNDPAVRPRACIAPAQSGAISARSPATTGTVRAQSAASIHRCGSG